MRPPEDARARLEGDVELQRGLAGAREARRNRREREGERERGAPPAQGPSSELAPGGRSVPGLGAAVLVEVAASPVDRSL